MKKGLLILFGESFRLGGQGNRNRGSDKSYDEQILASESHMKLVEILRGKGFDLDVSINSYSTKFDSNLREVYKNSLIDEMFHKQPGGRGQNNLIHTCLNRINNIEQYEFILNMRIDIRLKEKFFEIFNPHASQILFPSVCWIGGHKCGKNGKHPRINDMMMFVPRKFFGIAKEIKLQHESWHKLVEEHELSYEDLDVMIDTFHDSDSKKDFNPIYYIVNRGASRCHRSKYVKFDKYSSNLIKRPDKK